jgi:hypothetical protein
MHTRVLILTLLLAACGGTAPESPTIRVAITPAAQPTNAAVGACLPRGVALDLDVIYAPALSDYDFVIQLGEPSDLPLVAAQIASEQISVTLNPENDLDLDHGQLAAIFSGRVDDWAELGGTPGAIQLWVGPDEDEARATFEAQVLRGASVFGGAHLATDLGAIVDAVAADPNAAGILSAALANDSVQLNDTNIELPVLAIAAADPTGAARDLLSCLQSELGQTWLSAHYEPFEQQ